MSKDYELTYLTRQDMTEEEAKTLQDKLSASIKDKSGTIIDLPKSYKKRLAYRIKKQDAAYVNTIIFQLEAAPLLVFKKEIDEITAVLRSLIVHYVPLSKRIDPEAKTEQAPAIAKVEETATPEPQIEAKEIKEEKKEQPEIKEEKAAPIKEIKKETAEEPKEEPKEIKKPRARKPKNKAEIGEIEQKLDEILK